MSITSWSDRLKGAVRPAAVAAVWVSPLFLVPIVFLLLHRLGWIARHPRVAQEPSIILVLLFYWSLAALLVAGFRTRRRVLIWVRARRGEMVLAGISLLITGVAAELALRILRPRAVAAPEHQTSPILHHRNIPGRSSLGMGGVRVVTNEDGFRSPYSRADFLRYRHRVVLLGDSYVFGLGVEAEQTVGAVLEQVLREHLGGGEEPATSVAVLNTGVISYSPYLERLVFREVVRSYRPTLTLLLLDVNDVGDDNQYRSENVSGDDDRPRFDLPAPEAMRSSLCERLHLCAILDPLWYRLKMPIGLAIKLGLLAPRRGYDYYAFGVEVGGVVETNRFFILRHPLEHTRPFFERTLGYVRDTARAARAEGSDFALVVMPRYFHWNDAECPQNWEGSFYRDDEPYEDEIFRFFAEAARAEDFPIWTLLESFRAHEGEPLVFAQDPHWNPAGHRLAGQSLAEMLIANGCLVSASNAEKVPCWFWRGAKPSQREALPKR